MTTIEYPYFGRAELTCRCGCGDFHMDDRFMEQVIAIRETLKFPFRVTSAKRCPTYNSEVSSTGLFGPHTTGRALDISASSRQRFLIMKQAMDLGMSRFGIGKNFIHIDDLKEEDGFDVNVIWSY